MDLQTVEMPRAEARAKFREYRDAVRARFTKEDDEIMRGYRAIARGQRVISLRTAISTGGVCENTGRPKLAVARANATVCWLEERNENGAVTFSTDPRRAHNNTRDVRRFPKGTLPATRGTQKPVYHRSSYSGFKAMVPPVPPALRPARGLHLYDTLWEVARWEEVPHAPGDPALLRKLGGDLYAVIAVWDLTELEKIVLNGRT